jgi:exodeoxyribonuclease III
LGSVDVASVIPQKVSCEMGYPEHDSEGRIIAVDFPHFSLANLYVPNSGASLDRLSYRTETWDTHLLEFMQTKEMEKPVIWLGDLNVAYTDMEVWNEGAKHLAKSAGTTPEERASFARQLDAGFVDAFRFLHPKVGRPCSCVCCDRCAHVHVWSGQQEAAGVFLIDFFIYIYFLTNCWYTILWNVKHECYMIMYKG